jgi:hypothetical protein
VPIRPAVPMLIVLMAAGCGRDAGDRISRERFIAANVALRTLPDTASAEQRAEALARFGVDAADLHRWVAHHEDDPAILSEAWNAVAHRLDSLAAERPEPLVLTEGDDLVHPPPPAAEDPPPPDRPGGEGRREMAEQLGVPRPPAPAGPRPGAIPIQ